MRPARSTLRDRALGWAVVLSLCGAPLPAGTDPRILTFRVGVEVVNLDLSVTDTRDRPVTNLGEEDVAVFEDGVRQEICLFTQEKLPISLAILIDSSASMRSGLPVAQAAAIRLIRTLRPQDRAAVVQFDRRFTVLQDFTSDGQALETAVRRIQAAGETALYNALYVVLKDLSARGKETEPRRRAVVVLSDGDDTASLVSDDQVLELARRAEVSIYAIGLLGGRAATPESTGLPTYLFTALARETGGRAYFPATLAELDGVYDRIAEELRTLYGLGYVSSNVRTDGKWRRIAIQTTRENLLLRHRPGYYAPRPDRDAISARTLPGLGARDRR